MKPSTPFIGNRNSQLHSRISVYRLLDYELDIMYDVRTAISECLKYHRPSTQFIGNRNSQLHSRISIMYDVRTAISECLKYLDHPLSLSATETHNYTPESRCIVYWTTELDIMYDVRTAISECLKYLDHPLSLSATETHNYTPESRCIVYWTTELDVLRLAFSISTIHSVYRQQKLTTTLQNLGVSFIGLLNWMFSDWHSQYRCGNEQIMYETIHSVYRQQKLTTTLQNLGVSFIGLLNWMFSDWHSQYRCGNEQIMYDVRTKISECLKYLKTIHSVYRQQKLTTTLQNLGVSFIGLLNWMFSDWHSQYRCGNEQIMYETIHSVYRQQKLATTLQNLGVSFIGLLNWMFSDWHSQYRCGNEQIMYDVRTKISECLKYLKTIHSVYRQQKLTNTLQNLGVSFIGLLNWMFSDWHSQYRCGNEQIMYETIHSVYRQQKLATTLQNLGVSFIGLLNWMFSDWHSQYRCGNEQIMYDVRTKISECLKYHKTIHSVYRQQKLTTTLQNLGVSFIGLLNWMFSDWHSQYRCGNEQIMYDTIHSVYRQQKLTTTLQNLGVSFIGLLNWMFSDWHSQYRCGNEQIMYDVRTAISECLKYLDHPLRLSATETHNYTPESRCIVYWTTELDVLRLAFSISTIHSVYRQQKLTTTLQNLGVSFIGLLNWMFSDWHSQYRCGNEQIMYEVRSAISECLKYHKTIHSVYRQQKLTTTLQNLGVSFIGLLNWMFSDWHSQYRCGNEQIMYDVRTALSECLKYHRPSTPFIGNRNSQLHSSISVNVRSQDYNI
ncbi:hypothetical protein J6590_102793 [Homalodisca vitripennis]|nr:hypothetical protein J6590_102793 [Homalodisca vitripennis]